MLSKNLTRIFSIALLFGLAGIGVADDIVFDANSSNFANSSWGLSWTHTIGGGQNRILIVGLGGEDDRDSDLTVSSIKYNNVNMHPVIGSSITEGTGYKMKTELYYLLDDELPSSGGYTIAVNYSGEVTRICGGGISLANVSQQPAEGVDTNSVASGHDISTDITVGSNGIWVVDVVGSSSVGSFTATTAGMVEQFNVASLGSSAAGSTKAASAGTTTMAWYHPSIDRMTHSVAAFGPVNISKAVNPYPPNIISDVPRNVELSWSAGDGADSHDIYLGTDFNNVNSADNSLPVDTSVYKGNQPVGDTTYDPYSIQKSGETYYWRIDEVDDAGPTITKGSIWRFTVEEYIAADFTGDGLVNNEDCEILAADWLKSEPNLLQADADLNGQVDFSDYGFLAGDWEPIPEGPIEMLISSIENTSELNEWSSNGTLSLSTEHVTDGSYSLKVVFGSVKPTLTFDRYSTVDVSGYKKIKFDLYVEGDTMTPTARFQDSSWSTNYKSWYYLYNTGFQTVEYAIPGIDTLIDPSALVEIHIEPESSLPSGTTLYIDNLRAMKGTSDDSWLANQDPGKPLIVVPGNVVENGDFELGYQGWGSWGQWDGGEYIFGSGSGDNVKSGLASASIICIVEGRGGIYREVSLEPGDYELRFWVKGSGPGVEMRYFFVDIDSVISSGEDSGFSGTPVGTSWTEKQYSVTVTGTGQARLYLCSVGINTLYYDAVSLAKTGGGGGDPPDPNLWTPKIVTLDGQRTLVDGVPFFPIGIYSGNPSALGGTGFNMTTTAVEGTTIEALDDCNDHGLMTWVNLSGVARAHVPGQAAIAARPFKRHPAVLCWYNCDEPGHSSWNVPPPEIRYMSTLLHEEDPNHPTSVLFMPWAPSNNYQYADTADILMIDPYSTSTAQGPYDWINIIIEQVDTLRDAAGPDKPMWIVLRFTWDSEPDPSSEYLYATTYGAITHTANGVLWFAYKPGSPSWSTLVDITLELEDLSPALVSDTSPLQVTVSDPDIHTIQLGCQQCGPDGFRCYRYLGPGKIRKPDRTDCQRHYHGQLRSQRAACLCLQCTVIAGNR
jgi:hypothetical protein